MKNKSINETLVKYKLNLSNQKQEIINSIPKDIDNKILDLIPEDTIL